VDSAEIPIRKRYLEIMLQGIAPYSNPKLSLEQYTTPADLAAELLFRACYVYGDIAGKSVIDLGTGTGRLAIGASVLGAKYVLGIDIDLESLQAALSNSRRLGMNPDWALSDISCIRGEFDTVIMNPPFGTKREHSDMKFLQVALRLGKVVYSIHKSATHSFVSRWLRDHGAKFEMVMVAEMALSHQFPFHKRRRYLVSVQVFRIEGR
jgi:putative methylase